MGRVKGSITKDRSLDAEALREVLKPIYEKLRSIRKFHAACSNTPGCSSPWRPTAPRPSRWPGKLPTTSS